MSTFGNSQADALDIAIRSIEQYVDEPYLETKRLCALNQAAVLRGGEDRFNTDGLMRLNRSFKPGLNALDCFKVGGVQVEKFDLTDTGCEQVGIDNPYGKPEFFDRGVLINAAFARPVRASDDQKYR